MALTPVAIWFIRSYVTDRVKKQFADSGSNKGGRNGRRFTFQSNNAVGGKNSAINHSTSVDEVDGVTIELKPMKS
jgi:hypothetical protein